MTSITSDNQKERKKEKKRTKQPMCPHLATYCNYLFQATIQLKVPNRVEY